MEYADSSFKRFLDGLKKANDKLDVIANHNKRDLTVQLSQLKLEKDILADEDLNDRLLEKINTTLVDIRDHMIGQSTKKAAIGEVSSGSKAAGITPLPNPAKNVTATERLKSAVAGVKSGLGKVASVGENIIGGFTDATVSLTNNPGAFAKKAYGNLKSKTTGALDYAKDVLGTRADYSVEQGRFAQAYSKTAEGSRFQKGGRSSLDVGADKFNELKAKKDEIDKLKAKMSELTDQGFTPLKGDTKKLSSLEAQYNKIDPRVAKGEGSDKVVKELTVNNKTIGDLLAVTKEQLGQIKSIKEALAPDTPKDLVEQKSSANPVAEEAPSPGLSLPSLDIGGPGGKAPKGKGIGGKILGGLGKAAKFLGPAAAIAGAAYSGFQGFQNTGANFDLKEGEKATTGQKVSSTLGGVASGLTFGLLDEKTASQGIHKAGSAIGNFFSPSSAASTGSMVSKTTGENKDMEREAAGGKGGGGTVISNNVSTNNTTKYVPMKAQPRPDTQGSALERYTNRVAVY